MPKNNKEKTPREEENKPSSDETTKNKQENIEDLAITEEMKTSYLDYAMSVIVARALPDVRDGLKPVHRRILYSMWTSGLRSTAKFRKSATVVGEVLGKYHPHGDLAVYYSMVRMAQDFSMRYPLINGQGNFGSMDGDNPAAYRYTEAKLQKIADETLQDIEKETVDFVPNFDGSHNEPRVLPSKLPLLLLNGTLGIAVGMATNIPPHNLEELIQAINHLIDNPKASAKDLTEFVKGPDFPTGGIIYNKKDIKEAYATGRGRVIVRAKTEIVEVKTNRFQIIVTEIPYQVNKANLIEKIADLVKNKKIEGIKDLRDESKGLKELRIVIDLKKDSYPKKILNRLFKLTQLQDSFNFNMLALIDGLQPKVLNLKTALEEYIKHREIVVKRRCEYELKKALDRAHILEGLKIALDKIDAVIKVIKKSKDKETAKDNLMKKFKLSERQCIAILEMKLQNLANLERLKIEDELKEKKKIIKELRKILASKKLMLKIVKDELAEIQEKYSDERRTKVIAGAVGEFSAEDLVPNEPAIVIITRDGYIKRLSPDIFKSQARGGKGVIGLTTKEEDLVKHFFTTTTHSDLLFFTTKGRVFQLKCYDIPTSSRQSKGQAIVNFLQLGPHESVSAVLPLDELENYEYLVMQTKMGVIKKVAINDFKNVRRSGLIAIKLRPEDILKWVKPSTGKDSIIIATTNGQAIKFKEKGIRGMGRTASGVRGIKLKGDDNVIGMDVIDNSIKENDLHVFIISQNGVGKRSKLTEYRVQSRGGSGIKTSKVTKKTGPLVSMKIINSKSLDEDLIIISNAGQIIRLPLKSVNLLGRSTQGVRLMKFKKEEDIVANVTLI
ncbi:DNA gyrase subunit A [Candidatus Falkowbacteria bacterium]|jgi:DNA gyrase subunit A|nr:DNA gyrase subunit A [Candidatus Falkowbacteria bacterium]MBT4432748.1 DNA gyrase subunit A [Candidatus Falkowbacteria bacterium]